MAQGANRARSIAVLTALVLVACGGAGDGFKPRSTYVYRFVDATARKGMAGDDSRTWGSIWQDYDLDGDADLFAGRHWRIPRLFVNHGRRFGQLQRAGDLARTADRHGCAWGEANGDGRPDLYCVQGADKGTGKGDNQLYLQTGDGFENVADDLKVKDKFGRGRTVNWIDFDLDSDLDLFVGNHTRPDYPNVTFRNDGGRFAEVDIGLTAELATVASSWADWDRDGDFDLLINQLEPKPTVAFENQDGTFVEASIPEVTGEHWNASAWGDYNGDGWPDLHLVSRMRSVVLRNFKGSFRIEHAMALKEGRMGAWFDVENDGDLDLYVVQGAESEDFQPVPGAPDQPDLLIVRTRGGFIGPLRQSLRGTASGNGDAVSVADFDRDGQIDLFVTNGYFHSRGYNELLVNNSKAGNWLGLDLIGDSWNPQGIGARIKVETRTRTFWRETNDGVSFRSQSESGYVHVGIAANRGARLTIVWPDGRRDCWPHVGANRVWLIRKGVAPCALD